MRFDICYVISHGFSARMILHTCLVKQLKKKGFSNIAIILPGIDDGSFKNFEEELGIKVFYVDLKNSFWTNEYMFFRKYIYEDIRNNPALWEKHLKSTIGYSGSNPWRKVKPHLYMGVHKISKHLPFIKKIFRAYEKSVLGKRKVEEILDEINPRVLISTYPVNFLEGAALHIGNRMKDTITIVQLLSWDNITCKGHFPAQSDFYISWGMIMTNELKEYYNIPDERIFETGVPHFDEERELVSPEKKDEYLKSVGLNPAKPYIFFGMSSPYFAPKEIDVVERLSDLLNRNIFGENLQLLVRPHPQNVQGNMADKKWLPRLDALKNERIAIDYPILVKGHLKWNIDKNDLEKLSNLISGCVVLINSGSTISIEGLVHDKPVILSLFDSDINLKNYNSVRRIKDYFHLKKLIDSGAVKVVNHYEELKACILAYLENPSSDKEKREEALIMECGKLDTRSCERVANSIQKILF